MLYMRRRYPDLFIRLWDQIKARGNFKTPICGGFDKIGAAVFISALFDSFQVIAGSPIRGYYDVYLSLPYYCSKKLLCHGLSSHIDMDSPRTS